MPSNLKRHYERRHLHFINFTITRQLNVSVEQYDDIRNFYSRVVASDRQPVVLSASK